MPSTHLALHFHVVFSTKDRVRWIDAAWRPRLLAYLGGIISTLEGIPETVGGVEDHIHLLLGLKATHRLADVVRELKSVSSRWVHDEVGKHGFGWQEGYGAFTVSPTQREAVRRYIENQEEHHRQRTFQEKYREMLDRSGVVFDERFLW